MKKSIYIFLTVIMLSAIYGCRASNANSLDEISSENQPNISAVDESLNENSDESVSENQPVVLIGSRYSEGIGEYCEVNEEMKTYKTSKDENININVLGMNINAKYQHSTKLIYVKLPFSLYTTEKNQMFIIDTNYDELIGFNIYDYSEGYNVKTEEVDIETAKSICIDFLENYIELEEYVFTNESKNIIGTNNFRFQFDLAKYINGIRVHSMFIITDQCGNIYSFRMGSVHAWENVNIPNLEDSVYIEGAKKRIEEFYSEKDNIKEIKDYEVTRKSLAYLEEQASDAIDYCVDYTVVYKDGTERRTGNQFFYLIP